MTFVSPGKSIKCVHRYDSSAPVLYGYVRSCFPLGEDIYAITFETGYDSVITVTTQEWNVTVPF